jgi:hypothetical protein
MHWTRVSVSRKPNFMRGDKGDETSAVDHIDASRDEAHANKSANWAAISGTPGNVFESRNAWELDDRERTISYRVILHIRTLEGGT